MGDSGDFQFGRGFKVAAIAGWILVVIAGLALIWFGFLRPSGDEPSDDEQATAVALARELTQATAIQPPATVTAPPVTTATTVPTAADLGTATTAADPATATTAVSTAPPANPTATTPPEPTTQPSVTVGGQGVNVRRGPGTNYGILGFLDAGAQAPVTGRSSGWWQITYNEAPGWVYGEIVTATDTENVPEVQPPAAPTLPPATSAPAATAVPPTAVPPTAAPPSNTRGLVVDGFQVEGAPGPYAVGQDVWFNWWISNKSSSPVEYVALGTVVLENGAYQKSWSYSSIEPGQQHQWRDHLYQQHLPAPGTYHLSLRICFHDGQCADLAGPVEIVVQ
jgi:uncharacterized protein YraI